MDINLRHLEAFVAVAKLSSFTKAARKLNVSQPTLTVQIRQLEETLTVRLLDRNTRSVRLTPVGQELAPVVENLLSEINAVVDSTKELSRKKKGIVRVAALPSIAATLLPRIIVEFGRQFPGVTVVVRDAIEEKVLSLVEAGDVDLGIGCRDDLAPDLVFTLLFKDHMSLVMLNNSPLARRKLIGLKDLADQPLILLDPESSVRHLVSRAFDAIGRKVAPAFEVTLMSTVAGMVRAGLGVAILPSVALDMGGLAGLRSRPLREPMLTREIGVIRKSGYSLSPAAESFLRTLTGAPKTQAL